jgi:uncharacterized protein
MDIRHETIKKKGEFVIDDDGKRIGKLSYLRSSPDEITIYHTEVDEKFRGECLGEDLVEAAVKYARENGLKVVPKCPFAKHVIDQRPEFQDVLA